MSSLTVIQQESTLIVTAPGPQGRIGETGPEGDVTQEALAAQAAAEAAAGTATSAAAAAELAQASAETARDAAQLSAGVYASTAAGLAATSSGDYFSVPSTSSNQYLVLYLNNSGSAVQQKIYPSAEVFGVTLVDPFPKTLYSTQASYGGQLASPSSGLTRAGEAYTVAASGRFYYNVLISSLGAAVGDTIRFAFRLVSGASGPANFSFRAGSTLIGSTIPFELIGGWFVADAVVPDTTTVIRIDWTNSTGDAVVITNPRLAIKRSYDYTLPESNALAISILNSNPGSVTNLWPTSGLTIAKTSGTGDPNDASIADDGIVTIPADFLGDVGTSSAVRLNGSVMTALVKVSTPALLAMNLRYTGNVTGTVAVPMVHIGDGWYRATYTVAATGGSTSGSSFKIQVDNRSPGAPAGWSSQEITLSSIMLFDGAAIPHTVPTASPDTYPDDEIVVNQTAAEFAINVRAGGTSNYVRWTLGRYSDPALNALGWRITALEKATRSGDSTFIAGDGITYDGEVECAIQEVGKSDFMGGATHGDQTESRALTFLVDGDPKPLLDDGSADFRCRKVEFIQHANLWEVDASPQVLTAVLVTRWTFERGVMRLDHWLQFKRAVSMEKSYLAMLPLHRYVSGSEANDLVSSVARVYPEYAEYDISAAAHNFQTGAHKRITTSGEIGVGVDIEIISGWTDNSASFIQDSATGPSGGNKIYFLPWSAAEFTDGDIVEFSAEYRIGVQ